MIKCSSAGTASRAPLPIFWIASIAAIFVIPLPPFRISIKTGIDSLRVGSILARAIAAW